MPHTGSIAVLGAAPAPAAARRPDRPDGRRPRGHDLGQDRQRDLLGRAGADVEPGRGVHPRPRDVVDVERGDARPRPACGWRPGRRRARRRAAPRSSTASSSRPCEATTTAAAPAADRAGRRRDHVVAEAARRARRRAAAIGLSPCTTTSGAGTTGSRKISSVPPDRHGLCDASACPVCSARSGVGRDPQQQRLAGVEQRQRLGPHRRLGARPADEALDRAVGAARSPRRRAWPTSAARPARPGRARTGTRCARAAPRPASPTSGAHRLHRLTSIARSVRDRAALHRQPHLGRRERHVGVPHAERLRARRSPR